MPLVFRSVHTADDAARLVAVADATWGDAFLDPGLVVAMAHAGNYAVVAEDDETGDPLGAGLAFCGPPAEASLHSHVVCVMPGLIGQGVGLAIKQHQRSWCRERGIRSITWTFDPLISRNAYFNLAKLGAVAEEYLVDFYGEMDDGVNAGQGSDRLFVRWAVDDAAVPGADRPSGAAEPQTAAVAVPHDIEGLRSVDPDAARAWRMDVRRELGERMAAGWRVVGFERGTAVAAGAASTGRPTSLGHYLLEKGTA